MTPSEITKSINSSNLAGITKLERILGITKNLLKDNQLFYESIIIGGQEWMLKNLEVTSFRNGDSIPHVESNYDWEDAGENEQPAWCYYDNDPENGKHYGKLYNWYAVNDRRGLAPEGWIIPSFEDWDNLIEFLGGSGVAGGKLKQIGTTLWKEPNGGATNFSGFSGLPGGDRYEGGMFSMIGQNGYWWSSSEFNSNLSNLLTLNFNHFNVSRNSSFKKSGFSVRCIKS